jgi:hypothetical protein
MIIKDKFVLLKDISNVLSLTPGVIRANSIKNGPEKVRSIMDLMESRIDHFTKKSVYSLLKSKKEEFNIVYLAGYSLPVSYNKPTKSIIINLSSFGVRDISPTNPSPRDLYASLVYGVCFKKLVTKKATVPDRFAQVIVSYILSTFVKIFGKEYGLLGIYSTQIPKFKFIISCYILASFFGIKGEESFRLSTMASGYSYVEELDELKKYDFSNINEFIKALSELKVLPGIGKYNFASKIYRFLGVGFLPVLEDCSRFISVMTASNVPGVTPAVASAAYYRNNEGEFAKIMEISKIIFR